MADDFNTDSMLDMYLVDAVLVKAVRILLFKNRLL